MNDIILDRSKIKYIGKNKEIISYLEKIADYYKQKYNLDVFIDICYQGNECYFQGTENFIFISLEHLEKLYYSQRFFQRSYINNLKDLYIFVLLHELKHCIDYMHNREQIQKEWNAMNISAYRDNNYHDKQPFEKRADEFANIELNRWL